MAKKKKNKQQDPRKKRGLFRRKKSNPENLKEELERKREEIVYQEEIRKNPEKVNPDRNNVLKSKDFVNGAIQIRRKEVIAAKIKESATIRIITFILLLVAAFKFAIGYEIVETNDMYPAVRSTDSVLYLRVLNRLQNNDVVLYTQDGKDHIGRIQGMPKTKVGKTGSGLITIDGNIQPKQERLGLFYKTKIHGKNALKYPSVVPENKYFILGDNREHAKDSRDYGFIDKKQIKGVIFTVMRRRSL